MTFLLFLIGLALILKPKSFRKAVKINKKLNRNSKKNFKKLVKTMVYIDKKAVTLYNKHNLKSKNSKKSSVKGTVKNSNIINLNEYKKKRSNVG